MKILPPSFFDRPVWEVCPELLGKYLVLKRGNKESAYMITEVEAYAGEEDQASHARFGETTRNAPMFGQPGFWYVYLVYGMYRMLNIVTGPSGYPSAILIRGIEENASGGSLRSQLKVETRPARSGKLVKLDGPGKVTKTLHIDKRYNNTPANPKTGLRIEDRGTMIKKYTTTKRVGIDYAGKRADKKRNFKVK